MTTHLIAGVCGTASKTYYANSNNFGSDTFCLSGNPNQSNLPFPTAGNPTTWVCDGVDGGPSSPTCTAYYNQNIVFNRINKDNYTIDSFTIPTNYTNSISATWKVPSGSTSAVVLVVGGGGGGGQDRGNDYPGGGGAGGVICQRISDLVPGEEINIVVGNGGAVSTNGSGSSFGTYITAIGGGAGGSPLSTNIAGSGGSGGGTYTGAFGLGTPGQGNDGFAKPPTYYCGGGGGGAGSSSNNCSGGIGKYACIIDSVSYNFIDLFGSMYGELFNGQIYFGGGGAGGYYTYPSLPVGGIGGGGKGAIFSGSAATAGVPSTGGGGGGSSNGGGSYGSKPAARGGSGIVMIRYLTPQ
jgi:hypothetical protein